MFREGVSDQIILVSLVEVCDAYEFSTGLTVSVHKLVLLQTKVLQERWLIQPPLTN